MILLVDDDPSVTASLALLLKQHGYATATAADARRGARRGQAARLRRS